MIRKWMEGWAIAVLLCMLSTACNNDQWLEYTLEQAGANRGELEKVLQHYADKPEKLAAAKYLIRNMFRYYTTSSKDIGVMKELLADADENGHIDKERFNRFGRKTPIGITRVYDSRVITSEYLIRNIDRAFSAYAKPWNRNLPFSDFCELLLPYRIGDEPLEEWWTPYSDRYGHLLSGYSGDDPVEAANLLCDTLLSEGYRFCQDFNTPHLGASFHLEKRVGKCVDQCDFALYLLRSLGIPCTLHRYYYSSETRTGHLWPVLRDLDGSYVQYEYLRGKARRDSVYTDNRRIGKIYRERFGLPDASPALRDDLPPFFQNPYLEDVSAMYFRDTLRLSVDRDGGCLYLGVFNAHGWIGIAHADVDDGQAVFPCVESDVVYAPLLYEKGYYRESGYPFLFDSTGVHPFLPDRERLSTVKLYRKYNFPYWCHVFQKYVEGSRFEASSSPDFRHPVLLHRVDSVPPVDYNLLSFPSPVKCRYLRYTAADSISFEISEINAFSGGLALRPVHVDAPVPRFRNSGPAQLYDGDPLTYFASEALGASVVYDFGREVTVDSLLYITRTDDNYIRPGDQYELFYHGGTDGWVSLGRQTAVRPELVYEGVPDGALLYLHDLTRGVEELVFHMENGSQVFISKMDVEP